MRRKSCAVPVEKDPEDDMQPSTHKFPGAENRNIYTSLVANPNRASVSRRFTSGASSAPGKFSSFSRSHQPINQIGEDYQLMPSLFNTWEEYHDVIEKFYNQGLQVIRLLRSEYQICCPDADALLEAAFRRYSMLKVDLDAFFLATVNYNIGSMKVNELVFYPEFVFHNMYDHLDWISDMFRQADSCILNHYVEHVEELKRILFQMLTAVRMLRSCEKCPT